MARKALGRGLDALIPTDKPAGESRPAPSQEEKSESGSGVIQASISEIQVGSFQPRKNFHPDSIAELAESIKSQGILQPLLVRPRAAGGYELIAGERRLRAAKAAGLEKVPLIVREADDRSALELALVENLQREDLDPIEEAEAYQRLLAEYEYTQEELSKRVGKDRATVSNAMRLLKLPEDMREDISAGRITAGHARAILMAGAESLMRKIRDAVVNEGISVREAERRAQATRKPSPKKAGQKPRAEQGNEIFIKDMQEKLTRELGTKVKIDLSSKGGKIEIHFYSEEELDRLYSRIVG